MNLTTDSNQMKILGSPTYLKNINVSEKCPGNGTDHNPEVDPNDISPPPNDYNWIYWLIAAGVFIFAIVLAWRLKSTERWCWNKGKISDKKEFPHSVDTMAVGSHRLCKSQDLLVEKYTQVFQRWCERLRRNVHHL